MTASQSTVVSMRLPAASSDRLKRLARRHGWTASDAGARLVEEGLRRAEFAFIDFRDSAAGRQAYVQGSSLAVWEIVLLLRSYRGNVRSVAEHLGWAPARVIAAARYAEAYPEEIGEQLAEFEALDTEKLGRMIPQIAEFAAARPARR